MLKKSKKIFVILLIIVITVFSMTGCVSLFLTDSEKTHNQTIHLTIKLTAGLKLIVLRRRKKFSIMSMNTTPIKYSSDGRIATEDVSLSTVTLVDKVMKSVVKITINEKDGKYDSKVQVLYLLKEQN